MSIQSNKLELIEMLLQTEDPNLIKSILEIVKSHSIGDFWKGLSDKEKKHIDQGIAEVKSGLTHDYEKLISPHR